MQPGIGRPVGCAKEQKRHPEKMRIDTIPGMGAVHVRWLVRGEGPYTVAVRSIKGGSARGEVRPYGSTEEIICRVRACTHAECGLGGAAQLSRNPLRNGPDATNHAEKPEYQVDRPEAIRIGQVPVPGQTALPSLDL